MNVSKPDELSTGDTPEISGVAVRCYRPLSAAAGEALLVAGEDLARLALQPAWSPQDVAQMRDLARHVMAIVNSISAPPTR